MPTLVAVSITGKSMAGAVAGVAAFGVAAGGGLRPLTGEWADAKAAPASARAPYVVSKIVDGDTIDVTSAGVTARVRLLNIDTPESVDPNMPPECLGEAASDELERIIPVGTQVRLEHDVERTDRYGRTLAAVYRGDLLVNAAMAEAGYGVPVTVGANTRFRPAVDAAWATARGKGVGLFDETQECTIPAQVAALQKAAAGADPTAATSVITQADALEKTLAGTAVATLAVSADREAHLRTVRSVRTSAQAALAAALQAKRAAAQQVQAAKAAAAKADAARKAAATAAAQKVAAEKEAAAQRAAAARRAAAAARQAAAPRRPSPTSDPGSGPVVRPRPKPKPKPPAPAAKRVAPKPAKPRTDTYTGCRAYGPGGTSVDSKGRRYTKIPC